MFGAIRVGGQFWPVGAFVSAWLLSGVPVGATIFLAGRRLRVAGWGVWPAATAIVVIPVLLLVGVGLAILFVFAIGLVLSAAGVSTGDAIALCVALLGLAVSASVAGVVATSVISGSRACRGLLKWSVVGGVGVGILAGTDGFVANGSGMLEPAEALWQAGTSWVGGQVVIACLSICTWAGRLWAGQNLHVCQGCGYDLAGVRGTVCPECGTAAMKDEVADL